MSRSISCMRRLHARTAPARSSTLLAARSSAQSSAKDAPREVRLTVRIYRAHSNNLADSVPLRRSSAPTAHRPLSLSRMHPTAAAVRRLRWDHCTASSRRTVRCSRDVCRPARTSDATSARGRRVDRASQTVPRARACDTPSAYYHCVFSFFRAVFSLLQTFTSTANYCTYE
jgi:hypothetical protein